MFVLVVVFLILTCCYLWLGIQLRVIKYQLGIE